MDPWSRKHKEPYVLLQLNSNDGIVSLDKCNGVSLAPMVCHFVLGNTEIRH